MVFLEKLSFHAQIPPCMGGLAIASGKNGINFILTQTRSEARASPAGKIRNNQNLISNILWETTGCLTQLPCYHLLPSTNIRICSCYMDCSLKRVGFLKEQKSNIERCILSNNVILAKSFKFSELWPPHLGSQYNSSLQSIL